MPHRTDATFGYSSLVLAIAITGCLDPDLDGLYRVESYTLNEVSCEEPGPEVEAPYPSFRVRQRRWFGVTIYPVYPCDESGVCEADNDPIWNLVTTEGDLDQVSMTTAVSLGDSCVLSSIDKVIEPVDDTVVLQNRVYQVVLEPYEASTCTTDNAQAMRGAMECVELLQLVGVPDEPATMPE